MAKSTTPSPDLNAYYKTLIAYMPAGAEKTALQNEYTAWKANWGGSNIISSATGKNLDTLGVVQSAQKSVDALVADIKQQAAALKAQYPKAANAAALKSAMMNLYAGSADKLNTYVNQAASGVSGATTSGTATDAVKKQIDSTGINPLSPNDPAYKDAYDYLNKVGKYSPDATAPTDKKAAVDKTAGAYVTTAAGTTPLSTATNLTDALKDYNQHGWLVDKSTNPTLWKQTIDAAYKQQATPAPQAQPKTDTGLFSSLASYLSGNPQALSSLSGLLGSGGGNALASLLGGQSYQPSPAYNPTYAPVQNINLPQDYAARSYMQDNMLADQSQLNQQNYQQAWQAQEQLRAQQRAAQPNIPKVFAAGGYLDATSGQQSQPDFNIGAQQGQQGMGIGAIPNMTQYTQYSQNPGVMSNYNDSEGDDGAVGGQAVPGQTNPMW